MKNSPREYAKIAGASAVAGSRSMLAPALANPDNKLLTVMAVMEMCGDKVPGVGDRIAMPGLIGRGISGAITGAALSRRRHKDPWLGGLLGAAGALALTYLTFYARKQLVKRTGLPDPLAGLLEDVLMIAAGKKLLAK
ncbi:MAG TPA: DUF4126 family protein [Chitinophaga sp.]|uniref:DUF4126 family protein n=1 Tax=Chitinophaga sp. TaxID=1869181 RepID=UPI002F952B37